METSASQVNLSKSNGKKHQKILNIGIVGLGYWGPKLARNIHEIQGANLATACDLREERLHEVKKLFPDTKITSSSDSVFQDGQIDGVIIATPVHTHYRLVKQALLADKHVLVEKPMTMNSTQAQELMDLAYSRNLTLMVGHTFQYNPAVEAVHEIIKSGELGKLFYLNATRVNLGLLQPDINVMWDLAPHDLSILSYILDEDPVKVSASGGCFVNKTRNLHEVIYMNLIYASGFFCNIRLSWLDPVKKRQITIVGNKKMLIYDDIAEQKVVLFDKGVEVPPYSVTEDEFHASYRHGDERHYELDWAEPLRAECMDFANCIANGATPRACSEDGLKVVKILETAQRSLQNNGAELNIEY